MSINTRQRNNTIAGFFVIMSVIGLVAIVLVLSDMGALGSRKTIRITFDAEIGVPGLGVGSQVMVAGHPVGRVMSIEPKRDPQTNQFSNFIVTAWVPDSYRIGQDAFAGMVIPIIGGMTSIDISPLGSPDQLADKEFFERGGAISGGYAPSIILRTAGIGPEQIEQIQLTIGRVSRISDNVEVITAKAKAILDNEGVEGIERLLATIEDIQSVVASVRENWPKWLSEFDAILANVSETTARGPELATRAETLMDSLNEGVAEVRTVVNEVSPGVKNSVANVERITQRVQDELLDEALARVTEAESLLTNATQTFEILNASMTTELPQVARILSNLRLSSDNLKLATIEIRNEPWRLLYTPSTKEAQQSLLHDAVRTYASAVSDLEASIVGLRALHERYGPELSPEIPLVQEALNNFEGRLERYRKEEERWGEILFDAGIKP